MKGLFGLGRKKKDGDEKDNGKKNDDYGIETSNASPPPPMSPKNRRRRMSVSAEVYGASNPLSEVVVPNFDRTEEEIAQISKVMSSIILFSGLSQKALRSVAYACEEFTAEPGEILIKQGDDGDYLYMIQSGLLEVKKCALQHNHMKDIDNCKPEIMPPVGPDDVAGELALLYNAPRAATCTVRDTIVAWKLGRAAFNKLVRAAAVEDSEMRKRAATKDESKSSESQNTDETS